MRVMLAALAAVMLAFGTAQAAPVDGPFTYAGPPAVFGKGSAHVIAPGVTAREITITVYPGQTMKGVLIAPAKASKPGPGLLFVHWLGDPATTNHSEFEKDAVALAKRGATSLVVDAMWAAPGWMKTMGHSAADDRERTIRQVVELKMALGFLAVQPGVDPERLAYVGHDFGAMFGALIAGSDARPRWYVLMAATSALPTWYTFHTKPADMGPWKSAFADLGLPEALARSSAEDMLFQISGDDGYVPTAEAMTFFGAAPSPKMAIVYKTDHALATPQVFRDRQAWLKARIF